MLREKHNKDYFFVINILLGQMLVHILCYLIDTRYLIDVIDHKLRGGIYHERKDDCYSYIITR